MSIQRGFQDAPGRAHAAAIAGACRRRSAMLLHRPKLVGTPETGWLQVELDVNP